MKKKGGGDIPVFGGGGGTITKADERVMKRQGTDRIFHAGTPLADITDLIRREYARPLKPNAKFKGDRALARAITTAELTAASPRPPKGLQRPMGGKSAQQQDFTGAARAFVGGGAGPGGAGKSTLIDELTSRFLQKNPAGRIAILANDPSHPD